MKKIALILLFSIGYLSLKAQFSVEKHLNAGNQGLTIKKVLDIDNDGDHDILGVKDVGSDKFEVRWIENDGQGNLLTIRTLIVLTNTSYVLDFYCEDFDLDGDMDFIFVTNDPSANQKFLNIYENNSGTYIFLQQIFVNAVYDFVVQDVDNDGLLDLLMSIYTGNSFLWYKNLGNLTFSSSNIIDNGNVAMTFPEVYDFDNDGLKDIIALQDYFTEEFDTLVWFKNLGGTYAYKQVVTNLSGNPMIIRYNNHRSAFFVDIDNDGDKDFLMAVIDTISYRPNYHWYKNLGGGIIDSNYIFIPINSGNYAGQGREGTAIFDINNDGNLDFIYYKDNGIAWIENTGGGNFNSPQMFSTEAFASGQFLSHSFYTDFNQDGFIDIISSSTPDPYQEDERLIFYKNDGFNGNAQVSILLSSILGNTVKILTNDIDGDGDNDVLSISDGMIFLFENFGNGSFKKRRVIDFGVKSFSISDIDGDGVVDIIGARPSSNKIYWYKNLGSCNFSSANDLLANINNITNFLSSDIDGDGNDDVLAYFTDDKISWSKNQGAGVFGVEQIISSTALGVSSIFCEDFDGDGLKDICAALKDDNKVVWYKNLGGGVFGANQVISLAVDEPSEVIGSDLDNDGDIDVISTSQNDSKIAYYENLGGGTFGSQQVLSTIVNARTIYAADVDLDGDNDVLFASISEDKVAWFKNLGGGGFDTLQNIITSAFDGSHVVFADDLDNDTDIDVIAGNHSNLVWFQNTLISDYQLKGTIFYDNNQNGTPESNELGMNLVQTQLQPTQSYFYSNSNGIYYFLAADTGTYVVSYTPPPFWNLTTDSVTYTKMLSTSVPSYYNLNFGFYPDTIITIVKPELTGSFPRCNDIINYWIDIRNEGTTLPSGVIQLQLHDSINYISAAIAPDSVVGKSVYWHYNNLSYFSEHQINLQVFMPDFNSMGDTLTSYVIVNELDSLGNVVYSNADTLNQVLVCAYDPNDKNVLPKGNGSEGYISINQPLEYLIRFQNTGNDTALTVIIKDTLDVNLDWSSLKLLASSHNMQVSIEQGGEAIFKFENIMLPDSNIDFLASQGFVKFSINQKPNLLPHTQIRNTGNIYFDFNPAVITNTVLNTIQCYGTPEPIINYNLPYLEVSNVGNYSYQWYYNDTLLVGATYDTLLPFLNGIYTVEILDSNACNNISSPYNFFSVHVNELSQLKTIVFPNPFSESTTILFDKNLSGEFNIHVVDIVGREVMLFQRFSGNKVEIHSKEIGKGLFLAYLTNIQTGERIFLDRLIVK